jgi:hypothetical protein
MRVGMTSDPWIGTLTDVYEDVEWAASAGAHTYWMAQIWRYDVFALTRWHDLRLRSCRAVTEGDEQWARRRV